MKLLSALALIVLFLSCSKNDDSDNSSAPYLGIYTSANKDTIKVSKNGEYVKLIFRNYQRVYTPVPAPTTPTQIGIMEGQRIITFDSVRVVQDQSFTTNEVCTIYRYTTGTIVPLPPSSSSQSIVTGQGAFGANTIALTFKIDGGTFNFSGIKTN